MATTNTVNANVTVKFIVNEKGNVPGKLADAELHFNDGVLAGLKLIGFAVWERRSGGGRNVTFPARQYSVNGERRSFALLRPIDDVAAQARIRDLIIDAYAELVFLLRAVWHGSGEPNHVFVVVGQIQRLPQADVAPIGVLKTLERSDHSLEHRIVVEGNREVIHLSDAIWVS
jgi:hypothetical protein